MKIRKCIPRTLKVLTILFFLTTLASASFLKLGIQLDSFRFGDVQLSNISFIWKKKLELQIDKVAITETSPGVDFTELSKALKTVPRLTQLFSQLTIETIAVGDITASLHWSEDASRKSSFTLISHDLKIDSDLNLKNQILAVEIKDFSSLRFKVQASGLIQLDLLHGFATGEIRADIAESLPLQLSFTANSDTLTFQGQESGRIETIKPVVALFDLDKDIEPWITEYLSGSRYSLISFEGQFPWEKPHLLLRNLKAEIRIDECEYTFAEGFEPIKSDHVDAFFSGGLLTIKPHIAHFYKQTTSDSWLTIDFNDPEDIPLTCYITADATANADIMRLLAYYDIDLPFQQLKGRTSADLTLMIHLNDESVQAQGTFTIQDSIIEYNNKEFHVSDALVTLHDSEVLIKKLVVHYENSVTANVAGTIDGKQSTGTLDITLAEMHLAVGDSLLTLQDNEARPTIQYTLAPEGDSFTASSSIFTLGSDEILLAPFAGSFSPDDFTATLPPTRITSSSGIEAEFSGSFSINRQIANLQGKLLKVDTHDLLFDGTNLPFTLLYNQELIFRTEELSQWHQNDTAVTLEPLELRFDGKMIKWKTGQVGYGTFFTGGVSGNYNIKTAHGDIFLNNIQLKNDHLGDIHGFITALPKQTAIHIPELKTRVEVQNDTRGWTASIDDLAPLHARSALLRNYQLRTGQVTISSEGDGNNYVFSGSLQSPRSLFMKNDVPINGLSIQGTIAGGTLWAKVNDDVNIFYGDNHLTAASDSIGYNIPEIVTLLKEYKTTESRNSNSEQRITFSLDAQNSFLYFAPDNRALADLIHFEYADGKTSTELLYGQGKIALESLGNQFTLEGMGLNDKFMGALLQSSTFQNGHMSMVAHGTFDHFSALVKINNTLLRKHAAFNNIMGFLNTVPALITFSMPEYSSKGVLLHSVMAGAEVINNLATFESLEVKSPLFSLTGTGQVDFNNSMIDMDINLTTRARTNIHKIPLIGYIITGEEKYPSITLEVTGKLADPDVKNPIFREIATLPFSMLYRTLKLPLNLVEKLGN
jgi:hypothetical protein